MSDIVCMFVYSCVYAMIGIDMPTYNTSNYLIIPINIT